MSFMIITLGCALCCLCMVHFRPTEVRRIDSEIGTQKYDEEEMANYSIGYLQSAKKLGHEKLENNDRKADESVQDKEEDSDENQIRDNEGGEMSNRSHGSFYP